MFWTLFKKECMTKDLYFKYPDTSRIRIKIENVMQNDRGLFWVKTEKLSFFVAGKVCLVTDKHVLVPLSIYREELNKFYKRVLS